MDARVARRVAAAVGLVLVSSVGMTSGAAAADPVAVGVSAYDIYETAASGFGCWPHTYTGTITGTGRMVGGTGCPSVPLVDETAGSGTLNDGSTTQLQLFTNRLDEDGNPFDTQIVLHLAQAVNVSSIELLGSTGWGYDWAAGFLTGLTVEIANSSAELDALAFGPDDGYGTPANDRIDVGSSSLGGIMTDTVTLRGFAAWAWGSSIDQWSIGEIVVYGTPAPVDTEPPVVSFSAHPATYTQADQVTITCSATDNVDVVSSTCQDVDLPAWMFSVGVNTLSARAWDAAGNEGYGETTFTTTVTYGAMETLTNDWVTKAGVREQLLAYLESAERAAARGKLKSAAGNLASYRSLLEAQMGKSIERYYEEILWSRSWLL